MIVGGSKPLKTKNRNAEHIGNSPPVKVIRVNKFIMFKTSPFDAKSPTILLSKQNTSQL